MNLVSIHSAVSRFGPILFMHFLTSFSLMIFRIVENEMYNQDWRSRGKLQIFQYQVLKWVLALFVGVVVGLVGFFSNIAVENIAGFKLLLTGDLMLENRYGSRLLQVTMPNSFYFLLHFA